MAMDPEELEPRKKKQRKIEPIDLAPLSVDELGDYIREMEAEIGRVKTAIQSKTSHRTGAESFFKR